MTGRGPGRCHKVTGSSCPVHYTRRVGGWARATHGGSRATLCPQTAWGSSDVRQRSSLDTWRGRHRSAQGWLQEPEHRPQATPENVPCAHGAGGVGPASRLRALPGRGATRTPASAASPPPATIPSNADVASRSVTARSWGSPEVHTQRKGPKPWENMSLQRQTAHHRGVGWGVAFGLAAAPGAGIGTVQGQGGCRCSRTDGVKAVHEVRGPVS